MIGIAGHDSSIALAPMKLARIIIFPIKSLDGVSIKSTRFTAGGILENDRIFAIYDTAGKVVNGKRTARVHELRCEFDPPVREVRLWPNGQTPRQFQLDYLAPVEKWLGDFFGFPVLLRHDPEKGFPDDREAFGPTIVSEASLRAVQNWFPDLPLQSVRRRFRANLELFDENPFCEDALFGAAGELKPFQIGETRFFGHNPCSRCVVPTRNPNTAQPLAEFQKRFMQFRKESLPPWANAQRFNHFYRFAVNTSVLAGEAGKQLRVGDNVSII